MIFPAQPPYWFAGKSVLGEFFAFLSVICAFGERKTQQSVPKQQDNVGKQEKAEDGDRKHVFSAAHGHPARPAPGFRKIWLA